jgi:hypothetical protein
MFLTIFILCYNGFFNIVFVTFSIFLDSNSYAIYTMSLKEDYEIFKFLKNNFQYLKNQITGNYFLIYFQ